MMAAEAAQSRARRESPQRGRGDSDLDDAAALARQYQKSLDTRGEEDGDEAGGESEQDEQAELPERTAENSIVVNKPPLKKPPVEYDDDDEFEVCAFNFLCCSNRIDTCWRLNWENVI